MVHFPKTPKIKQNLQFKLLLLITFSPLGLVPKHHFLETNPS